MTTRSFGRKSSTSGNIGKAFSGMIVWIVKTPGRIIIWLTGSAGGQMVLGLLIVYFFLINVESYWQSFAEDVFMPKPGINDGANIANILRLLLMPNFWLTILFCLGLNTVSALYFRDLNVRQARKRYEEVAGEKLPSPPNLGTSLTIASVRYRQLRSVGMKSLRMAGIGVIFCLTVDAICNHAGFPWIGFPEKWPILFAWWLASFVGVEVCGALLTGLENRSEKDN